MWADVRNVEDICASQISGGTSHPHKNLTEIQPLTLSSSRNVNYINFETKKGSNCGFGCKQLIVKNTMCIIHVMVALVQLCQHGQINVQVVKTDKRMGGRENCIKSDVGGL